jgi:hypothetical protein
MSLEMENGLPTTRAIDGLMPTGRSRYALVAEYLSLAPFVQKAHAAYDTLRAVADEHDLGRLQPPLTEDMAEAVVAFREAGAEATSQYHLGADFLLKAVFQHAHRSDSV